MTKKRNIVTCAEAALAVGPGTQVYWRPDNRARRGPLSDKDPAEVLAESSPDDAAMAALALKKGVA
jgi:hypothetical protein